MILHEVELTYVGLFRDSVRLGPFHAGLNLLCAPNESGKSTALRATARALFDKHTTKGDELKSLQPAGTELPPRVSVEFETGAGRFRITKTFLLSPRSLLQQLRGDAWHAIAEADAADQRVQELLRSSLPGRGATRPEHWGFLGFLWARQGEPAEWPKLEDEAVGQQIRARLARVELDPVIDQLQSRLATTADGIITSTGQPRTGGPLRQAEDDLAAIDAELALLRRTRGELDHAHQRYQTAVDALARLEKEHAERAVLAKTLAEQALTAERRRGEIEARQVELNGAKEKLNTIAADAAALAQRQLEIARTRDALTKAEETMKTAETKLAGLHQQIERQQSARPTLESQLATLRAGLQRIQNLLRLRQLTAAAQTLEHHVAKADAAAAQVTTWVAAKAKLPGVTITALKKLEELAELVRTQKAELQALGLTVELTPERASSVTFHDGATPREQSLPAGQPTRLHRPQSLDLALANWGRITIRSGAREAQTLAQEFAASEVKLTLALQEAEVPSVAAARDALAQRRDVDSQIKAAEAALHAQLGEHPTRDALREAAIRAARRTETLAGSLQPTADELARSHSQLDSEEARQSAALPGAEQALRTLDRSLTQLRDEERAAAEALQRATAVAAEHRTRLHTLESQATDLAARYPEGLDVAKARAQVDFIQAEARVAATRASLPADFEKLPDRNKRAAAALQQLANELQLRRSERDNARGALEILGGQGLYSRETGLEERKAEALLRRDAARTKAWAARIAHQLIEHRKQAATRAVLTPLEERLSAAFAELTGDHARKVFLDEQLQIAGIGRNRAESYPFESLSEGAKEQLLLCLRIAVAQELALDEPQVLILDDVLVNTDAVRQERILDVLSALSSRLQIIVLTCHADRYRGVGHAVTFSAA